MEMIDLFFAHSWYFPEICEFWGDKDMPKSWGFFGGGKKGVDHAIRGQKEKKQVGSSEQKHRSCKGNTHKQGEG